MSIDAHTSAEASMNVLVMGMHRSGTSAVAGSLRAAGLSGGDDAEFMPSTLENPAGYWEREEIRQYNDRLLRSLGWAWDAPPAIPPSVPPPRPSLVEEGRRLLQQETAPGPPFFIKDPRLSLLLPWWRQILLDRFVAIVVMRSPDEVAWSLSVRNGFPVALGQALWSAYHRHLAIGLAGLPVILVDYPALACDPGTVVPHLLSQLERLGVSAQYDEGAAVAAIRPVLRRATHPSAANLTESSPPSMTQVVEAWSVGTISGVERFEFAPDPPHAWEITILELHREVAQERERTAVATDAIARARGDAEATRAEVMAVSEERRVLADRATALEMEQDEFVRRAERDAGEREALGIQLSQMEAARDDLRGSADGLRADGEALRRQVSELEAARDDLRSAADRLRADGEALGTQLSEMKDERDDLRSAADRLRADGEALGTQLSEMKDERDDLRSAADRLRADGEALRRQVSELEAAREEPVSRTALVDRSGPRRITLRRGSAWISRWVRRPLKGLWLLATFRLWRHLRTNPLFDADWYLSRYVDVRENGVDPRTHYWSQGVSEGRDPNPVFETAWYLERNPDVVESGLNPLDHYWFFGAAEGRDPSRRFDSERYLTQNPDVRAAKLNPLLHYLRYGILERRPTAPCSAAPPPEGRPSSDVGSPTVPLTPEAQGGDRPITPNARHTE